MLSDDVNGHVENMGLIFGEVLMAQRECESESHMRLWGQTEAFALDNRCTGQDEQQSIYQLNQRLNAQSHR
jgi:hypothetical protein